MRRCGNRRVNEIKTAGRIHSDRRRSVQILVIGAAALIAAAVSIRLYPGIHERNLRSMTLTELQSAAAENSSDERALYWLSNRYEMAGDQRRAMEGYWKAIQLNEDDEQSWPEMGQNYGRSSRQTAGDSGAQAHT